MTVTTDGAQTGPQARPKPKSEQVRALCTHCGGTGEEPGWSIPPSWQPAWERLVELGQLRRERQLLRSQYGEQLRAEVYEQIRPAVIEAESVGMTQEDCGTALGVGRMAIYNIMTGKVGSQSASVRAEKAEARRNAPPAHRGAAGRRPASPPPRADHKWTEDEIQVLKNTDLTNRECADQLGRPLNGVAMKRKRLGVAPSGD